MSASFGYTHQHERNFTIVSNNLIRAAELSLDTKAVLIWMLSNKDGFELSHRRLRKLFNIGHTKLERIVSELKEHGYLIIQKFTSGKSFWHCFECPELSEKWQESNQPDLQNGEEAPNRQKSQISETQISNPETYKKNYRSKKNQKDLIVRSDKISKEDSALIFERIWKYWPRKEAKKPSLQKWHTITKGMTRGDVIELGKRIVSDIATRLQIGKYGFTNTLFKSYLNQERWNDEVTGDIDPSECLYQMMGGEVSHYWDF